MLSSGYYKLNLLEFTKYSYYKWHAAAHTRRVKHCLLSENGSQKLTATLFDNTKGDKSYVLRTKWRVPSAAC